MPFSKSILLFTFILFFFSTNLAAQDIRYHEEQDDPYLGIPRNERVTSKAYSYFNSSIVTRQVNVDENGDNIVNDAANEPSLGLDRTDPTRMVIGWRQFDNIESNFRQAGIAYTSDAGVTWNNLDPIQKGIFRSDPVLATDKNGKFYYNSLTSGFSCDVFMTTQLDDWDNSRYAYGGDKQWMDIDRTDLPSQGNIYAIWNGLYSSCESGNFSQSSDSGESWEGCQTVNGYGTRGTVSVDPNGYLYACGSASGSFVVTKSTTADDPYNPLSWQPNVQVNLGGQLASRIGPNPAGLLGQVWIATDHSDTETRGNVYLLSTVTSSTDPSDIKFSRSLDGGKTWSSSIRINKDAKGYYNWFGTISVAPNGRIDVVWLDTRGQNGFMSSLYYSYSDDAGNTWSKNQKMSESFDPHVGWPNQSKMGDYFHMISLDEGAHLAWAGTFNGEQDVYYSFIQADPVTTIHNTHKNVDLGINISPNPITDHFTVSILSNKSQELTLTITDILGKIVFSKPYKVSQGQTKLLLNKLDIVHSKGIFILNITKGGMPITSQKVIFN